MIRRVLAVLAACFLLLLMTSGAASAAVLHTAVAVGVAFTLDPAVVVQLLIAFVMPVLVGLVTTRTTSAGRKAWLLAGLTLVTSLLVELARALSGGLTYDLGVALLAALPAFVVSVSTHYGLWKPTGIAAAAQNVGTTPAP